jgi:FtsH-binding integral membrane protein
MIKTMTTRVGGVGYIIATIFALLAGSFLAWLEWGFIRSWSNGQLMYGPPIGSVIGIVGLLFGLCLAKKYQHLSLRINTYASAVLILMATIFLVEIIPIAQGNNDSGEVFWFIVLPAIWLFIYAYRSDSKSKSISIKEAL